MTVGMQQHPVFCPIAAAIHPCHAMVIIPSRLLRDFLLADGAHPVLSFPKGQHLALSAQGRHHFALKPLLEVGFPGGVIRVGCRLDFRVPFDRHLRRIH